MRGILMIEPLYHQVIAGNKTQTRRSGGLEIVNKRIDEYKFGGWWNEDVDPFVIFTNHFKIEPLKAVPRYRIGEVLYLKEPYLISSDTKKTYYKYDDPHPSVVKWSNKLFMPASAARAFIRITDIRCEGILEISDKGCFAEGIEKPDPGYYRNYLYKPGEGILHRYVLTAKESFITLYKLANKMKATADTGNPWVWAYTFEFLKDYQIK